MITIKCPDCGQYFDMKYSKCPHCPETSDGEKEILDSKTQAKKEPITVSTSKVDRSGDLALLCIFFGLFTAAMVALYYLNEWRVNFFSKSPSTASITYTTPDIPKKDGTYETVRHNDLEELCKDWYFYRKKILEAHQVGDSAKVTKYQESFRQVNKWINEYNEKDIQAVMSRVEKESRYAR